MKLNKEQREIIEKHVDILKMAYLTSTVRGVTSDIKIELGKIYTDLGYMRVSLGCSTCCISVFQTLYSIYLGDLKEEENNKIEEETKKPKKNGRTKLQQECKKTITKKDSTK